MPPNKRPGFGTWVAHSLGWSKNGEALKWYACLFFDSNRVQGDPASVYQLIVTQSDGFRPSRASLNGLSQIGRALVAEFLAERSVMLFAPRTLINLTI